MHGSHDYFKQLEDPLEKYLCVFLNKVCAFCCRFFSFTIRSNFSYIAKEKKTLSKFSVFEILSSWYISSLKPKGKDDCNNIKMGLVATKPVSGVSDKARLKPVSSATETSYKTEISLVTSLNMVLSKTRITKALIRLRGCAGWSAPVLFANSRKQVFSHRGPNVC